MGRSRSPKREICSDTGLPLEARKISNNLTSRLEQLEKEEKTKPEVGKRKEVLKIRVERNGD